MGFLDSILGEEAKSLEVKNSSNPFSVSLSFSPLRLSANKRNSVSLIVKVKNISSTTQLVSVDALLPKDAMIGFDPSGINKAAERKAGEVKSGDFIAVPIEIWANSQTKAANYPLDVTVYSHYIGYDKVFSYTKKSTSLRTV